MTTNITINSEKSVIVTVTTVIKNEVILYTECTDFMGFYVQKGFVRFWMDGTKITSGWQSQGLMFVYSWDEISQKWKGEWFDMDEYSILKGIQTIQEEYYLSELSKEKIREGETPFLSDTEVIISGETFIPTKHCGIFAVYIGNGEYQELFISTEDIIQEGDEYSWINS